MSSPPLAERLPRGCGFWGCASVLMAVMAMVIGLGVFVVWVQQDQDVVASAEGIPLGTIPYYTAPDSPARYTFINIGQGPFQRRVDIIVPADPVPGERLPMVVVLHGHSANSELVRLNGGWDIQVAKHRFIALLPNGIGESWNAGNCCRPAMTLGMDDVAFIDSAISDMAKRPEVDPARVFMVGESNGGMMTYRYLCDHADRIVAAASVIGTNVSGCEPSRALPFLHVAGTSDEVVPYGGGSSAPGRVLAGGDFPPARDTISALAAAQGCAAPTSTVDGIVETVTYAPCSDGSRVEFATITGLTHVWPRGEPYDASSEVVSFFGLDR